MDAATDSKIASISCHSASKTREDGVRRPRKPLSNSYLRLIGKGASDLPFSYFRMSANAMASKAPSGAMVQVNTPLLDIVDLSVSFPLPRAGVVSAVRGASIRVGH